MSEQLSSSPSPTEEVVEEVGVNPTPHFTLHTDHHFVIGSMHTTSGTPCQDYALSGVSKDADADHIAYHTAAYGIVSDGCSGGGPHTDVGARVVTWSLVSPLLHHLANVPPGLISPITAALWYADRAMHENACHLGITNADLLATRLWYYTNTRTGIGVFCIQGDGVFAYKTRDGSLYIRQYEWSNNTPYYPAYGNPDHSDQSTALFSDVQDELRGCGFRETGITCKKNIDDPGYTCTSHRTTHRTLDGIRGVIVNTLPVTDQIEYAALFTDGVTQVAGVDWVNVITTLLAFKTSEGEFVKRRLNAAVKSWAKDGHTLMDDLGMAVVRFDWSGAGQ